MSQPPNHARRPEEEAADKKSDPEGVALAVTFLIAAALCTQAPSFFDADGWQRTTWNLVGAALALVGVAGMAVEVGRMSTAEAISDFGFGITFLLLATALALAAEAWDHPPQLATGTLKAIVAFCLFFGIYGSATGIAKAIQRARRRRREDDRSWTAGAWIGLAAALLGLATAAVNLYGAFQATPPSP
jgi:hypothetical protein